MRRAWWIFFVAVFAGGSFLWNEGPRSSGRFIFDNMRDQKGGDLLPAPSKSLVSAVGEWGEERGVFRKQPLVFSSHGSSYFQTGKINGRFGDSMPPEMGGMAEDASVARQGELAYGRYCAVCHGLTGDGKGQLAQYPEFPSIGSFWSDKYKNYPMGKIFLSISEGQGNMPSFYNKMTVKEIWESVRWVVELQNRKGILNEEEKR